MKKVLLVDVDSLIPNLALMKISAYHKAKGDRAGFDVVDPDVVYASVIFKKNVHKLDGLQFFYPNARRVVGGPGTLGLAYNVSQGVLYRGIPYVVWSHLGEMEFLKPDYDLYPDMEYSLGFTTRGCVRRCKFCIVSKKEGRLKRWQHPRDFHDDRFDKIMLLDNNWLADKEWFMETSKWIRDQALGLIENGLDIRLLDEDRAVRLREMRLAKNLHFAFDNMKYKNAVLRGIGLLKRVGFDVRREVQFYVYVDSDNDVEDGRQRCEILKEHGASPWVMLNVDVEPSQRMKDLYRWSTRKHIFWTTDFKDYDCRIKKHK